LLKLLVSLNTANCEPQRILAFWVGLVAWPSGSAFHPINRVRPTLRRAGLILRWVTGCGQVNHLGM